MTVNKESSVLCLACLSFSYVNIKLLLWPHTFPGDRDFYTFRCMYWGIKRNIIWWNKTCTDFFQFSLFWRWGDYYFKKKGGGGSNLRALRCKHLKPKNRKHHMKLFLMTFVEIPKQHNYIWIALRHLSNSQISNTPSLDHCLQILDWGSQERET